MASRLRSLENRLVIVLGTRGLRALVPGLIAIFLAVLLALPSRTISSWSFDGYISLTAFFLQGIARAILPPGWHFIFTSPGEALEIYIVGAVVLALMIGSPLIGYLTFDRIVPRNAARRRLTTLSLTTLSSVAFLSGALLGFYLLATYLLPGLVPHFTNVP